MVTLAEVFNPSGGLLSRIPGYTYREAQQQMAELVWRAINEFEHAALEAGTGIGKTYAYLIPVLLSGRRAIISTGTLTLQDQLFGRDLPSLGKVLGRPVTVALLKGRNNYLCWHRLEAVRHEGRNDAELQGTLDALSVWGRTSSSGDLTELDDFEERHSLRGAVTSTVDNCLGNRCDHYERCFVLEARRRAQAAQVVIVNHHLLLADLALKEAGFGELLPGADTVVVDEAHQLPETAQQFFGISVSSRELEWLLRDVHAESRSAPAEHDLHALMSDFSRALAAARARAGAAQMRVSWQAVQPALASALAALAPALAAFAEVLGRVEGAGAGLQRCRERADAAAATLQRILEDDDASEGLRWLALSPRSFAVHWTPIDVGAALAARIADQGGTWVFTSATLALGDDFSHFLTRVGIDANIQRALPSPFDYSRNARLYLPEGMPAPSDPDFTAAFMQTVWPLVESAGGGAFLLFTSYRALQAAQQWLAPRTAPGPVFVQGEGSRSALLEQFRAAGNAILLGTGSFWQGVDVRGPALRLVAIDKLPFAVPSDPLVQARIEAIRRSGGDAFNAFQLPQAALALKQGVGRLIRDFEDRGLIVIGDPRMRSRGYGRVFIKSLPPIPLVEDPAEAEAFAAGLSAADR
jgi:ATP-dependent DNA helicase DinG